ncbi:MAG: hypothetical protein Q9166_006628 [cf. Caloplaca sp. 2 TL-2023]
MTPQTSSTFPPSSPLPAPQLQSQIFGLLRATYSSILSTYHTLLRTDSTLTPPLAAISSLIALLAHTPPSTTSETLSLLSHASGHLKSSVLNPIALSAGTDLFQRYIVSTLQSPSSTTSDFRSIRDQLIRDGKGFVARAKEARGVIARTAKAFVRDGGTVLTMGGSRVVSATLNAAADSGVVFRLIYVGDSQSAGMEKEEEGGMVAQLRRKGIAAAVIVPSAVAYSLAETTIVMVGAEGVVENGGIVSRLGTYQMAMLAKSMRKPLYVVAESHKFVRLYPLGQGDLPVRQRVLNFRDYDVQDEDDDAGLGKDGREEEGGEVDFTPPELITTLVTEVGPHTPSAVSEELIKIWY